MEIKKVAVTTVLGAVALGGFATPALAAENNSSGFKLDEFCSQAAGVENQCRVVIQIPNGHKTSWDYKSKDESYHEGPIYYPVPDFVDPWKDMNLPVVPEKTEPPKKDEPKKEEQARPDPEKFDMIPNPLSEDKKDTVTPGGGRNQQGNCAVDCTGPTGKGKQASGKGGDAKSASTSTGKGNGGEASQVSVKPTGGARAGGGYAANN